jgi:hypothetical protein
MKYKIVLQNKQVAQDASLRQLCKRLVEWITTETNIAQILVPYIVHDTHVSKRLIYWTVSKYAQQHAISIIQSKHITHVYAEYTNNLRTYNRRLFDVFCRQPFVLELELQVAFDVWKAIYNLDNLVDAVQQRIWLFRGGRCSIRTTLGQLNFFHWASTNGILSYIQTYQTKLLDAMKSDSHKRRLEKVAAITKGGTRQSKRTKVVNHPIVILYQPCSVQV